MEGSDVASSGEQFDPRFDPAFQRGYDGPALTRPMADVATEPAEQGRIVEPPRSTEPRAHAGFAPDSAIHGAPVAQLAALPPLRGNPWVRALWLVCAVLTVVGVIGQTWAQQLYTSATSTSAAIQYILPSVLSTLSPWLLGAGLAAGIATLLLHASRWRASD